MCSLVIKATKTAIGALPLAAVLILALSCCSEPKGGGGEAGPDPAKVRDDWVFVPEAMMESKGKSLGLTGAPAPAAGAQHRVKAEGEIGFSVGGAKDINNFRENVKNNFLPVPTDLTYEGIFYDYFFDTGEPEDSDDLFYPGYTTAVTGDPVSGKEEYYLTVGLNSGMTGFERKKLNLVVVLDISGSMGSAFDQYYYDRFGKKHEIEESDLKKRKIDLARNSIVSLMNHLEYDDRFGVVLFDNQGYLAKPLRYVGETDMDALKGHIRELEPQGGTNMAAGMALGAEQFNEFMDADKNVYENRIIFLTDAMPNRGEVSEQGLFGLARQSAESGVHSTFIGIGVDFNTELVEAVTKIRGANYYSVHSSKQFKERMDDEFEFMVTPLVFGLELNLESGGYMIDKVYGSPEADEATGSLLKVNTLFPSKRAEEATRGGVVLLKLSRKAEATEEEIFLSVRYEDRQGKEHRSSRTILFESGGAERFDNTGIRKAVLLARYVNLLKAWMIDERKSEVEPVDPSVAFEHPLVRDESGIIVPPEVRTSLGQWERQSRALSVSEHYVKLFGRFIEHFSAQMQALGDDALKQELEILDRLLK